MNNSLGNPILCLIVLLIFIISCQPKPDKIELTEDIATETIEPAPNPEEEEIIAAVEKILLAAGNYNIQDLDDISSDKAVIGFSSLKDGIWTNTEMTIEEYFDMVKTRENIPFSEIPTDFDIIVTEGRLAFVRADAILSRFGVPGNREINHLTLIKEDEDWKLLSIAWTAQRLPEDKRTFDLNLFAHSYAQAWSSQKPEFVAMFFEEDGSLQVNDGDPAKGRGAITNVARSFMTKFPDMIVHFDSLVYKSNGSEFHWTLTGTDADPDGKGHKVKVSGFELWTISEDGFIKDSQGNFSDEEYNRQLEFGIEN